jgi:hypothetical protein
MARFVLHLLMLALFVPISANAEAEFDDSNPLSGRDIWFTITSSDDGVWDLNDRISHGVGDLILALRLRMSCRLFQEPWLCRMAEGEVVNPVPHLQKDDRSLAYHIDDSWALDDPTRLSSRLPHGDGVQAVVFYVQCADERQCDWGKELITFESRPDSVGASDQLNWRVKEVTTPWCWRRDRTAVANPFFYLRPLLAAAAAVICDGALVRDPLVPRPDGRGQGRFFTMTDSNSPCVGQLTTPRCALDTVFAAHLRRDKPLWRRVTSPDISWSWSDPKNDPPLELNARTSYQVMDARRLTEAMIPPVYREECPKDPEWLARRWPPCPAPWHPGDVLIRLISRFCRAPGDCTDYDQTPDTYVFRREWDGWHYVSWENICLR